MEIATDVSNLLIPGVSTINGNNISSISSKFII